MGVEVVVEAFPASTAIRGVVVVQVTARAPGAVAGGYVAELNWDPEVLGYVSDQGPADGFMGMVNRAGVGAGVLAINGARRGGQAGDTLLLSAEFRAVGVGLRALGLQVAELVEARTLAALPVVRVVDGAVKVRRYRG